ncbi:putative sulfate exporter family transporter [Salinibacterium sp. UTAS2018]|uniref:YeiH family protein n=1 Tax=Salinibacterium sp. UTAS2018 TaxID=2508880 RepID=UPI0010098142|nr:putative sulfate exporter family transporter [Salinibacterium sp. UTAS2018]QAV71281.1 putative sulfate exporter family transporter [Salinibacterium sp. UTAS2018]
MNNLQVPTAFRRNSPGLGLALAAFALAVLISFLVPAIPTLTACVVLGILFAALPWRSSVRAEVKPGLAIAARRLLRIGVVLLGFKLSLVNIAELGWLVLGMIVAIVVITFFFTWGLGRMLRLPGQQPVLIAAGFSICGASAIGAMAGVTRAKDSDTATPIALVTLCGTLAIALLPALRPLLGLDTAEFGMWVGASVHDVGQVVATAQIAGATALAVAVVVKLTRVAMLAPMVALAGVVAARADRVQAAAASTAGEPAADRGEVKRPAILPLFVVGFLAAVLVRTFVPLPDGFLEAAGYGQELVLGMALFGLGASISMGNLVRTGGRALVVALISWAVIALLSYGAVEIARAAGVAALG